MAHTATRPSSAYFTEMNAKESIADRMNIKRAAAAVTKMKVAMRSLRSKARAKVVPQLVIGVKVVGAALISLDELALT